MAGRLLRVAAIAVCFSIALWFVYTSFERLPFLHHRPHEPAAEIPRYETWGIRDMAEIIEVSSMRVRPAFEDTKFPVKKPADVSFTFTEVNLTQPIPDLETQHVSIPAETHKVPDASHLLVGMATKLDRLRDALPRFTYWASGTNVRFIIVIDPREPGQTSTVEEITALYEDHKIPITIVSSPIPWYDAYVSLLAVLYDHATPSTQWACIMDDDTHFFSMKRILAMLARYDSSVPYYIGGLSENKDTINRLGILGYGGSGLFFSIALLKDLRPYNERCIALPDDAGDLRTFHCIYKYTTTKFTWEHYLFQMDIHGDLSGFYEAARERPLSTHHWNSWHHTDMMQVSAVGRACGNECVLQKYVTRDGWYLTNGFSIVKYSYNETVQAEYIEGAMEHTWADTAFVIPTSWNYTLAPLKPKDEGKIQYKIEKVEEGHDDVTIFYVRRKDGLGKGIIRMTWEKTVGGTDV